MASAIVYKKTAAFRRDLICSSNYKFQKKNRSVESLAYYLLNLSKRRFKLLGSGLSALKLLA